MTIYEEVHSLRAFASPAIHRKFLQHLALVLPRTIRPILVTDARFRGAWFRMLEALGWHWVGRIRNLTLVQLSRTLYRLQLIGPEKSSI